MHLRGGLIMLGLMFARVAAAACASHDVHDHLATLADPALDGRVPGTAGERAARAYVIDELRCAGVDPAADGGFEQPFAIGDVSTANVVGVVPGRVPDELVVIGAHLDHLGGGKLGANDNASGVAALLAVAQAVHAHGPAQRSIVFVVWSGEEAGLLGSSYFVAHPPAKVPLAHVVEYVNLDMIGSYNARHAVYAFGAGAKQPAHALLAGLVPRGLDVRIGGHSERGDQLGFCEHGIPYVFLWTPDPRCYHATCDTLAHVDLVHTVAIAQLAGNFVLALADSGLDLIGSRTRAGCGQPVSETGP